MVGGVRPGGGTPLLIASQRGRLEVIVALLGYGADVNFRVGDDEAVGADDLSTSPPGGQGGGNTPLFLACQEGHLDVAVALVEHGANLDWQTSAGGTALIAVLGSQSLHELGFQLLVPTLSGASILVAVGLGNNLFRGRRYPQYWW